MPAALLWRISAFVRSKLKLIILKKKKPTGEKEQKTLEGAVTFGNVHVMMFASVC